MIGLPFDCSLHSLLALEAAYLTHHLGTTASARPCPDGVSWQVDLEDIGESTPLRIIVGDQYPLSAPTAVLVPAWRDGSNMLPPKQIWVPLLHAGRDWRPGDDLGRVVSFARHRLGI